MSTVMSYLEQREQLHARLADQAPTALLDGFAAAARRCTATTSPLVRRRWETRHPILPSPISMAMKSG